MAERPDLDAIRERLHKAKSAFPDRPYSPRMFHQQASDTAELLTYCRELEAENKRLAKNHEIDEWIQKWTFPGGIYEDAPPPPVTGPWPGNRKTS